MGEQLVDNGEEPRVPEQSLDHEQVGRRDFIRRATMLGLSASAIATTLVAAGDGTTPITAQASVSSAPEAVATETGLGSVSPTFGPSEAGPQAAPAVAKRFIFNLSSPALAQAIERGAGAGAAGTVGGGAYLFTQGPAVQLDQLHQSFFDQPDKQGEDGRLRTAPQLAKLSAWTKQHALPESDQLFGPSLGWAYRRYVMRTLHTRAGAPDDSQPLYLFNLLVAAEWKISRDYFQRLQVAFRQASDLLYDVTDGLMAFGQVVFGDESWMEFADIQIMASNQMLPRSWVSGLLIDNKYNAIRVGRGAWVRNRYEVIPWEQADGFHALIHEWAHYALEQRDTYLAAPRTFRTAARQYTLVTPTGGLGSHSIMATPAGRSELDNLPVFNAGYYPVESQPTARNEGPWRLPLPLPSIQVAGTLSGLQHAILESTSFSPLHDGGSADYIAEELAVQFPHDFSPQLRDDWSIYLLRHGPDGQVRRIVAQGLLDAAAVNGRAFTILGAADKADTMLLIGKPGGKLGVLRWSAEPQPRQLSAPTNIAAPPFVDVIPLPNSASPTNSFDHPRDVQVVVRVDMPGNWTPTLFPLGRRDGVPSEMDGLVMVRREGEPLLVCNYSRGGSPCSCYVVPTNPLSAGASDGGALIFGHAPDGCDSAQTLRDIFERTAIVTTSIPYPPLAALDGARALSNVFSIASIGSIAGRMPGHLDGGLNPTLTLYYDPLALRVGEVPRIYRQIGDENIWTPLPTFVPSGSSFVAAPLTDETAPDLIVENDAAIRRPPVMTSDGERRKVRVERFCLFVQSAIDLVSN